MDFGLNRWNTYELTAPDGWEADLDAGGMEDEWMRRCGALGAYGVGDRDGLAIARLDWRWLARGRLGGPVHAELRVYLLGDEDGRFDLYLTEEERAALDADIRDWLESDGVIDASGNVIGGRLAVSRGRHRRRPDLWGSADAVLTDLMLLSAVACLFSPVFLAGETVCGVLAAVCGSVSLRRLRRQAE